MRIPNPLPYVRTYYRNARAYYIEARKPLGYVRAFLQCLASSPRHLSDLASYSRKRGA